MPAIGHNIRNQLARFHPELKSSVRYAEIRRRLARFKILLHSFPPAMKKPFVNNLTELFVITYEIADKEF